MFLSNADGVQNDHVNTDRKRDLCGTRPDMNSGAARPDPTEKVSLTAAGNLGRL